MLNKEPIIVSQRNLHIATPGGGSKSTVASLRKTTPQSEATFVYEGAHDLTTKPSYSVRFHGDSRQDPTPLAVFSPAAASGAAATVGSAPGPAPMMAPGSAPSPANSAWTMDEDMGAAEQGFSGETVEHDNMKTMTKDWRNEYGKHAGGLRSYVEICALYPDNTWCRNKGYHTPAPRSSAVQAIGGATLTFVVAAAALLA